MLKGRWALILGASSGFGAATARAFAHAGMNIFGVHLDPRRTIEQAEAVIADVEAAGSQAVFFNTNAADARRRARVLEAIAATLRDAPYPTIHMMVHTLAFGSLRPYIAETPEDATTEEQMEMTLRVMAHSLVYWTQDLVRAGLLGAGSRIYALSSIGSQRAAPYYGAVSAAKAALEAHMRQLALELAPRGIAVNCLMPGVTDTPALRAIPGHEKLIEAVLTHHPAHRLTTPEDVAHVLVALADPRITWISGATIPVDGGEAAVSLA
ncbi:MAG TPA: SDR family oxidoreductase [Anaerolineae bacterium]|nr:SDR family oxidoreductase [Anaerolineae bacterium]HQK14172.1 SDR family oxidoreductase [Anaerolineae bacterium]